MYRYTDICTCKHTHTHTHTNARARARTLTHTHTYTHTHAHARAHTHTHIHTHTHTHISDIYSPDLIRGLPAYSTKIWVTHKQTHTHTHTYTHTHTHIHTGGISANQNPAYFTKMWVKRESECGLKVVDVVRKPYNVGSAMGRDMLRITLQDSHGGIDALCCSELQCVAVCCSVLQ